MNHLRNMILGLAFVLSLSLVLGRGLSAQTETPAAEDEAAAVAPDPIAVDPFALKSLEGMSAHLQTLTTFALTADTTVDAVYSNGQKLQFGGQVHYKVRRPDGFVVELVNDRKVRHLYYNGETITLFAPGSGFFAVAEAPATIREVLDILADGYGIEIPMTDLFRWNDPNDNRAEGLISGVYVGYAKIKGKDADHFAFREEDVDWQVWIARGERPLPLKLVITSTTIPEEPQFVSYLTWTENPQFEDAVFEFTPGAESFRIEFDQVTE